MYAYKYDSDFYYAGQQELTNYLPLSGGTVTGGLTVEGTITGNLAGNADTATNPTNDPNGSPIAGTYLP